MAKWTQIQKKRLQFEGKILRERMPGFRLVVTLSGAYVEGSYTSSDGRMTYTIRVEIQSHFPDQVPLMFIISPNPIPKYRGGTIASICSHDWHTLGAGRRGSVEICHFRQHNWDASQSLINVAMKGILWGEAHAATLQSGKTIAYYFEHPEEFVAWVKGNTSRGSTWQGRPQTSPNPQITPSSWMGHIPSGISEPPSASFGFCTQAQEPSKSLDCFPLTPLEPSDQSSLTALGTFLGRRNSMATYQGGSGTISIPRSPFSETPSDVSDFTDDLCSADLPIYLYSVEAVNDQDCSSPTSSFPFSSLTSNAPPRPSRRRTNRRNRTEMPLTSTVFAPDTDTCLESAEGFRELHFEKTTKTTIPFTSGTQQPAERSHGYKLGPCEPPTATSAKSQKTSKYSYGQNPIQDPFKVVVKQQNKFQTSKEQSIEVPGFYLLTGDKDFEF